MARASSGFEVLDQLHRAFMSAKSVVTVLRSPSSDASGVPAPGCIGELAAAVRCDLAPAFSSGFAHSMQNFAVREFSVSQEGQRRVNAVRIFSLALRAAHRAPPARPLST